MSRAQGFANQPSRANQEFVKNSQGNMVRNIAYKGSPQGNTNRMALRNDYFPTQDPYSGDVPLERISRLYEFADDTKFALEELTFMAKSDEVDIDSLDVLRKLNEYS